MITLAARAASNIEASRKHSYCRNGKKAGGPRPRPRLKYASEGTGTTRALTQTQEVESKTPKR